jgi:hypothetical protein
LSRTGRSPSRCASANHAAAVSTPVRPTRCCISASTSALAPRKRRSSASPRFCNYAHLADAQKAIPEKTPEKVALGKSYRDNRAGGANIAGLNDWNRRWVGPDGYRGMVARQLQEFKKAQRERQAALVGADESEQN